MAKTHLQAERSKYANRNIWRDAVLSKDGPPEPMTRLVLLAIGSFAGANCQCYPGMDLIAERAAVALKTVWTHVHKAEQLGWIRTVKKPRARGKRYVFTSYTLQVPAELDVAPTSDLPTEPEIEKPNAPAARLDVTGAQTIRRGGLNHVSQLLANPALESITKPVLNPGTAKKPAGRAKPQTKTPELTAPKTKSGEQEASEEWIAKTAEHLKTHAFDDFMRTCIQGHGQQACHGELVRLTVAKGDYPNAEEFAAALRALSKTEVSR